MTAQLIFKKGEHIKGEKSYLSRSSGTAAAPVVLPDEKGAGEARPSSPSSSGAAPVSEMGNLHIHVVQMHLKMVGMPDSSQFVDAAHVGHQD
uniref:Uncharacterized protein n=1 Tax=Triticum urartu TaxID=4572 RepID=A0A8R7TK61_TRIUA